MMVRMQRKTPGSLTLGANRGKPGFEQAAIDGVQEVEVFCNSVRDVVTVRHVEPGDPDQSLIKLTLGDPKNTTIRLQHAPEDAPEKGLMITRTWSWGLQQYLNKKGNWRELKKTGEIPRDALLLSPYTET